MSGGAHFSRIVLAVLLLACCGAVLIPWQAEIKRTSVAGGFHPVTFGLELREQIGQSGFLAALSGFRAPVAALLWIEAHTAWERTEWGRMAAIFRTVTTLQPHNLLYWDIAAWHMAWNASAAALQDKAQKSEILRERARRQYIRLGREILKNGITNNPDSYLLHERLGILLRDKEEDHAGAADEFSKAATLPGAPEYLKRFAAYETAKVPGREREAYERLRDLYQEGGKMRTPAVLRQLGMMEDKLGVPATERMGGGPDSKQ